MKGIVLWGVNNIYCVQAENNQVYEARIKGKVLRRSQQEHNALAVGDWVELQACDELHSLAMISSAYNRFNCLWRFNLKTNRKQAIAANIDQILILISTSDPSFRPAFLDRALVMAQAEKIPALIVMNKQDLGIKEGQMELWNFYCQYFKTLLISVKTGWGLEQLNAYLDNKTTAIFGQSGVGKSSLVNSFIPEAGQQTQSISKKYNRGRHTTVYSLMLKHNSICLIDTPGVKELSVRGVAQQVLQASFPELKPFLGRCRFKNCSHLKEPQCAVTQAFASGYILPERWQSFLSLMQEISGK